MQRNNALNPNLLIMCLVIFCYACMANLSFSKLKINQTPRSLYQYLSAGFLKGQLNLSIDPPAELLRLPNPLDAKQNKNVQFSDHRFLHQVAHDASLYKGKFYLYFGPLPVIVFFIPFKFITGFYPGDALAVFFFVSLGFIFNYLLLIKIKEKYFPNLTNFQLIFAGLLLGFANNSLFLLARPQVYEIAIACAFSCVSIALYFLFQVIQNCRIKDIFLFSLFLSLSMASRFHFVLAALILIPIISIYLLKHTDGNNLLKKIMSLFLPFITISGLLAFYNYVRFDSIFEFGISYQLLSEAGQYPGLFYKENLGYNFVFGLYNYFFRPPSFDFDYPYIHFIYKYLDPRQIYYGYLLENSAGVLCTAPFLAMIFLLPGKLLESCKKETHLKKLAWFISSIAIIPFIIVGFFLTLSICTQRYISDFLPYLILLAILSVWLHEKNLNSTESTKIQRFYYLSGIASIYIGFSFGFCLHVIKFSSVAFNIFSYSIILNPNYCILVMGIFSLLFVIFKIRSKTYKAKFNNRD